MRTERKKKRVECNEKRESDRRVKRYFERVLLRLARSGVWTVVGEDRELGTPD